jgi:hypothetical protein
MVYLALTMPCMTRQLESSAAARWRARTAGPDEQFRNWQTRVGYYHAVVDALRRDTTGRVDAGDIIRRHEHGRRSTFYAVATHKGLLRSYRAQQSLATRQLGDLVTTDPVSQLVAEAKVWSFWPVRQAWVRELDGRNPTGELVTAGRSLVRRLAGWRAENPALAAAQDGIAPLCAVEDLMILSRHTVSASQAGLMLSHAAASGELTVPDDGQHPRRVMVDEAVLADVIGRIDNAVHLLLAHPNGLQRDSVVAQLRSAARRLSTSRCEGMPC